MPDLEVLVGPIASGKSTYARRRARAGAMVVSHDDLTAMLHAEYRYEPGLRDAYRVMEEHLVHVILRTGRDVIVDRTHLTLESRARWVRFASWSNVRPVAVVFPDPGPYASAVRRWRADARGRSLAAWYHVACHHAVQALAEPLDGWAECFEEVRRIEAAVPDVALLDGEVG